MLHCSETRALVRPGHSTEGTGHVLTSSKACLELLEPETHTQAAALTEFTAKHLTAEKRKSSQSGDLYSFREYLIVL